MGVKREGTKAARIRAEQEARKKKDAKKKKKEFIAPRGQKRVIERDKVPLEKKAKRALGPQI